VTDYYSRQKYAILLPREDPTPNNITSLQCDIKKLVAFYDKKTKEIKTTTM